LLHLTQVNVDQFCGIEIQEFPVRIAETALWIMDHQMNIEASVRFGKYFVRLPLKKSPTIILENALQIDWNDVLPKNKCSYILGNPPYAGKKEQTQKQKADADLVLNGIKNYRILDYVANWFIKAAYYIEKTCIRTAFLSTNSITQGEQVGVLWNEIFRKGINIHFAYRPFIWTSEAKGKAHVHCVIIGVGHFDPTTKYLFYEDKTGIHSRQVKNINPYLVQGNNIPICSRRFPISDVPIMNYGSMMIDKARGDSDEFGLTFGMEQRKKLLKECSELKPYIRRFYGGNEFINGLERWCLWLVDAPPGLINKSQLVRKRINKIREYRLNSDRSQTKELANSPTLFGEIRQPRTTYLLIPKVSSERRRYIPIGFMSPANIASGSTLLVANANNYHFGILSSYMHNVWMKHVCGRMKSDYQYSSSVVYNNFPWPNATEKQKNLVMEKAKKVLAVRKSFSHETFAALYDPLTMPKELLKAHRELDKAVDLCYRSKPFADDQERLAVLFDIYEKLTLCEKNKNHAHSQRS
ncbi:MAG: hypothetical protein LBJ67_16875, partial [Planctomycetaceae bacterium]|nr:hypothetical protein [Planctomycetaceae bacterium]